MSFSLSPIFSPQQNWRTRGQNRFCPEVGVGVRVAQTMYTCVSKCKNDKIKVEKTKKKKERKKCQKSKEKKQPQSLWDFFFQNEMLRRPL
jgi:hypothetical protein